LHLALAVAALIGCAAGPEGGPLNRFSNDGSAGRVSLDGGVASEADAEASESFQSSAVSSASSTNPALPGSYVVTATGLLLDGRAFTKLAMYSFQPGGRVRQDYWSWYNNEPSQYGPTSRQVGHVHQPTYPHNVDQAQMIQGMTRFHGGESSLTTAFGTWTRSGHSIAIAWSDGTSESWRITWRDPRLFKIELVSATYVSGRCYLSSDLSRSATARNAGWGFGGPGPGFTEGRTLAQSDKNYTGLFARYNAWTSPPSFEPVARDSMTLLTSYHRTNADVERYVFWDGVAGSHVFAYLSRPQSNPGMLARRVMYQISHDFGHNGHIGDDIGHTYSGLQILDATGVVRGFVFSDSSPAGANNTISALTYLDDWSWDALYGIDPELAGK
jgi:hypothetical protein